MALLTDGRVVPQSTGPGVDTIGMLSLSSNFLGPVSSGGNLQVDAPTPTQSLMARLPASAGAYLGTLAAILALLLVFKFASEHESSGMEPHLLGIGVWNFVAVGTIAVLSIASTKIIVNKYLSGFKPLVDIVNMV